jgi:hypothetical protein
MPLREKARPGERAVSAAEIDLDAALRTFRDTGVLVLEGLYEPSFINTVRAAYEAELDRYLASKGGLAALEGKTFGKNHIGFFPPLHLPLGSADLVAHPAVVRLLTALLGEDLHCSFVHTNTAMPGSLTQSLHRDQQHLFGAEHPAPLPVTSIVLNIPLCDFTPENGSTEYWPGTHLVVDNAPGDGKLLEKRAEALPSRRLNMKVGSAALRDLRVWHRGVPNTTDQPRTMYAIVYQRAFLSYVPITVPRSSWETWPEQARRIFRRSSVVADKDHRPVTWEEMR